MKFLSKNSIQFTYQPLKIQQKELSEQPNIINPKPSFMILTKSKLLPLNLS